MSRRIAAVVAAAAVLAVYLLRLDDSAGLFVDDAWYIVLATALSRGEGFRLVSSAVTPILPAFPPGFSAILAPIVAITPEFPDNVPALKSVSIAAMVGAGAATYRYLVRYRSAPAAVALTIAVITTLLPSFVFLATSTVMAEAVFTFGQLCVALSIERAAREPNARGHTDVVLCGAIAGATLLVRLAGIAGIAAGALYLWHRRRARSAIVFATVTAVCYLPWAIYSVAQRDAQQEHRVHGGSVSYGYDELLLMRYGGEARSGRVNLTDLLDRIATNLVNIAGRDVGAFILPSAYRGAAESGQEVFGMSGDTGIRASSMGGSIGILSISLAISATAVVGFVAVIRRQLTVAECIVSLTIAMVALVPALTFRYVLPLAPFILFYFFCGVEVVVNTVRRRAWSFGAPFRITAAIVLLLVTWEHAQYVWSARFGPAPAWLQQYEDTRLVTDWMNEHLHAEGFVASNNPGLVYLATGRKGVSMGDARTRFKEWQALGVRYAAALQVAPKLPASLGSRPLYESPRLKLWVSELPSPADRKSQ